MQIVYVADMKQSGIGNSHNTQWILVDLLNDNPLLSQPVNLEIRMV